MNSGWLVGLVRRLMELENNLIQLETGKIVLGLLRRGSEVPYDFARKLLPHGTFLMSQPSCSWWRWIQRVPT